MVTQLYFWGNDDFIHYFYRYFSIVISSYVKILIITRVYIRLKTDKCICIYRVFQKLLCTPFKSTREVAILKNHFRQKLLEIK